MAGDSLEDEPTLGQLNYCIVQKLDMPVEASRGLLYTVHVSRSNEGCNVSLLLATFVVRFSSVLAACNLANHGWYVAIQEDNAGQAWFRFESFTAEGA